MPSNPKTLVATTSDPRCQELFFDWLSKQKLLSSHVRIAVSGCVKDREAIMKSIRQAKKSYGIQQVILINALGDKAYSERKFANQDLEKDAHRNDLKNTAAAIKAESPNIQVELFLIDKKHKFEAIPLQ
ncbi:hypothetical protein HZB78_01040 [Candidatus Collierbacteria bacterium]|nr:hypothetical protein [Candidatus Collierbacteria bacterium]